MLRKLLQAVRKLSKSSPPIDPSSFNDPLALRTEWTPAKGGGASFCTHKLTEVNHNRIEFSPATGAKLFCLVFVAVGIITAAVFVPLLIHEEGTTPKLLIPLLIGLVFTGVGGGMYYWLTTPIVFDKYSGYFWKARAKPDQIVNTESTGKLTRLHQIHAIQLISEYCTGDRTSYYSYELNLVLEDGRRLNVIDHGKLEKLRADARVLAAFLGVPVWDAIAQ